MASDLLSSGAAVNTGNLNAGTTTKSKTDSAASQTQLSSDINFFLKMLTTQLKNQDPTSPLDTNQFTQQIAQYSSVQQQVTTNANLEKLLTASKQSSVTTAVGYIGKEVETKGNSGQLLDGQAAFSYILPRSANTATITIKNASGQTVFTGQGNNKEGRNLVVWDGVNSSTGQREDDGVFTISVAAIDASNKEMLVETRSVTLVSGVETDSSGNTLLTSGNIRVNFSDVLAVRTPTRADFSPTSVAS